MAVDYSKSEEDRELIIRRRQKNTAASFERMRRRIDEQISEMNMSTVSERAKRQQLEEIRDKLQKQLGVYYSDLEDGLKSDMVSIGQSVLSDSAAFYNSLGMPISMSITSFPVEIMENVINGTVYGQKWFLSDALWGDYQSKLGQINDIVTQGIGMNLSSLDIAKQLEQYVDPKAMKPSQAIVTKCLRDPATGKLYSMDYVKRHPEKDWSNFAEKTSRYYYGKVDYNAQRLARTLVSHAYQQNVVRQAQANPFASGVKWEASGGERMCEICEERDGKIFPVDDVPLDHPNGMCTFTVETPSMMEMSDNLAKWANGEPTDWDDQLNAYYEGRPIEHKFLFGSEGLNAFNNEKQYNDFKDWYSNISNMEVNVINSKIRKEFGKINNSTKEAFYNKYILKSNVPVQNTNNIKVAEKQEKSAPSTILEKIKAKFNPCGDLLQKESSNKAILMLSGGDMTSGSCSSLSLAYIGRRNGIDVLDFRGGTSRDWFADKQNKVDMAKWLGADFKVLKNNQNLSGFSFLEKAKLEPNKEYLVGYARHMAVVRHDGKGFYEYLELQSPKSIQNGWNFLNDAIMETRFGSSTAANKDVYLYDFTNVDMGKFKEALGYINTSSNEQQKGSGGNVK